MVGFVWDGWVRGRCCCILVISKCVESQHIVVGGEGGRGGGGKGRRLAVGSVCGGSDTTHRQTDRPTVLH